MDPEINQMNNAQLLAAIVNEAVAHTLMQRFGSLNELARASLDELMQISGIGKASALAIKSAFTLAARLTRESWNESPVLDTPQTIADLLREENRFYEVECFQVLLLNTRRRLIRLEKISQGTLDTLLVHPREVFKMAIAANASAILLVHNHPSGDPTPSEGDIKVTRDLMRAGQLLKIDVIDHIILGRQTTDRPRDFVSLRELGYLAA